MRVVVHIPEVKPCGRIANDPVSAGGGEALALNAAILCTDPAVLAVTQAFPECFASALPVLAAGDLLVLPMVGAWGDEQERCLRALPPGVLVLVDGPIADTPGWRQRLAQWPLAHTVTALRERIVLGDLTLHVPENLPLALWQADLSAWRGVGQFADRPFLVQDDTHLFCGTNTLHWDTILRRDPGHGARAFRCALADVVAAWLRRTRPAAPAGGAALAVSKRSEFQAYAFHRWVARRTAELLGEPASLEAADSAILAAAQALLQGDESGADAGLRAGFAQCRRVMDRLCGTEERLFAEAHHGGLLCEEIGYYEHDWPQSVVDSIRQFLQTPGVVLSLQWPAAVFRHYQRRFPSLIADLNAGLRDGRVELTEGTLNQPYSDYMTLESMLAQFASGMGEYQRFFGCQPAVFVEEEYSLGPAMPQVLAQAGLTQAVHNVRLGGAVQSGESVVRPWQGDGGTVIAAIPETDLTEPGASTTYFMDLPQAFARARELGRKPIVLFNVPDFGWNILFRDELFAGLRFDAPLVRMVKFADLFARLPRRDEPIAGDWQDSYHPALQSHYPVRNQQRRYLEALRSLESLCWAAEARAAMCGQTDGGIAAAIDDLLVAQGHDHTDYGAAYNGWYGAITHARYEGPLQLVLGQTLEERAMERMRTHETQLRSLLAVAEDGPYFTNPHGFPVEVMAPTAGGHAPVSLPPFGSVHLEDAPQPSPAPAKVRPTGGVLENSRLRLEIAPATGHVTRAVCDGTVVWDGHARGVSLGNEAFTLSEGALTWCEHSPPRRRLHHQALLSKSDGEPIARVIQTFTLDGDDADLLIEITLQPFFLPERVIYNFDADWNNTFRLALPRRSADPEIIVCQMNGLYRGDPLQRPTGKLGAQIANAGERVNSPEVIGYVSQSGVPVWYYNTGYPFYRVTDTLIEHILVPPGENRWSFRVGLGFGESRLTPVQRSRRLLYPPLRTRTAAPELPVAWDCPEVGLLRLMRQPEDGTLIGQFFNYADQPVEVEFRMRDAKIIRAATPGGEVAVLHPRKLVCHLLPRQLLSLFLRQSVV